MRKIEKEQRLSEIKDLIGANALASIVTDELKQRIENLTDKQFENFFYGIFEMGMAAESVSNALDRVSTEKDNEKERPL